MNNRRKLIIALGAGALVAVHGALAQQRDKVWRVGYLTLGSRPVSLESSYFGAFPRAMQELGYAQGKNLVIEWRFAQDAERLPSLAAELVQTRVDVIVTAGAVPAISAAQKATTSIPIVMGGAADPVGDGFIKSLARPGGNITGITNLGSDISAKQLEMLRDVVPALSRIAILINPDNPSKTALTYLQAAAPSIGVTILALEARTPQEIDSAFSQVTRQRGNAVIVPRDPFLNRQARQIAELAVKNRLPTVGGLREYAEAGGLMSYGNSITDQFRRAAIYVDKILKGANPADLPVEQPTKFEMVINAITAKALGLTIPQSLLVSADEVIR